MADYYSLLARAISNLPKSSPPSARLAIYDRARTALVNQLRSLKPALPDSDIAREENALDQAVARLEAECEAAPPAAPAPPPPPKPAPPPPRAEPALPSATAIVAPASRPRTPLAPLATAPLESAPRVTPPLRAPLPPRAPILAPRATAAAVSAPAVSAPAAVISPPAPLVAPPLPRPPATPAAALAPTVRAPAPLATSESARAPSVEASQPAAIKIAPPVATATIPGKTAEASPPPPVATPKAPRGERPDNAPKIGLPMESDAAPNAGGRLDVETSRPAAPAPSTPERKSPWPWIALAVAVGLIGSVAVAAFLLREKPQDLTVPGPSETTAAGAPAGNGQKMAQRVDGAPAPSDASPAPNPTANATPNPAEGAAATTEPAPLATAPPVGAQAIPVAARAAMLVAEGNDTQNPAVNLGAVVWTATPAIPGQPGSGGFKAEVDIPDLKMHASMVLRKNLDPGLPASHTIDFRATFDPGSPIKGIKDIGVPIMRREDPPAADPLLGVHVKINDGYYLIGLNRADSDVTRNIEAIGTRGWFDFPMQLADDRIAKLTFEKAGDGEKIVSEAIAAWK